GRSVVVAAARHLPGTARTARVVVARTRHHLAVTGLGGVLRVLGRSLGGRTRVGSLGAGGGAFALALVFALRFLAALLLLGVLRLVGFAEIDIEVLKQFAGRPRIGLLIEDRAVELGKILADARFEPGAPQIDDPPRGGRRALSRQCLAGEQTHRLGHRAFGALG